MVPDSCYPRSASACCETPKARGRKAGETAPTVVRYLSAATLTVKTQKDLPNRIYAPVLELEYAEVRVATGADPCTSAFNSGRQKRCAADGGTSNSTRASRSTSP